MTRFLERPTTLLIILAALTAAVMIPNPSLRSVGVWIITGVGVLTGAIWAVWPERSGVPAHPTGIRLAGIFILAVFAFLIGRDLINFAQGAM